MVPLPCQRKPLQFRGEQRTAKTTKQNQTISLQAPYRSALSIKSCPATICFMVPWTYYGKLGMDKRSQNRGWSFLSKRVDSNMYLGDIRERKLLLSKHVEVKIVRALLQDYS